GGSHNVQTLEYRDHISTERYTTDDARRADRCGQGPRYGAVPASLYEVLSSGQGVEKHEQQHLPRSAHRETAGTAEGLRNIVDVRDVDGQIGRAFIGAV